MRVLPIPFGRLFFGSLVLAIVAAVLSPALGAVPRRVVSLNACTDQLLLSLAPPERILSLSYLSADPAVSAMAQEARHFPLNHGAAEEIVPLRPDLILTGPFTARAATDLLRRLHYPVATIGDALSLEDIPRNIRHMGVLLGEDGKAERLAQAFEARLAALSAPGGPSLLIADYQSNGMTSGAGTMLADIAHHAGLRLLGEALGKKGIVAIPLEELITAQPDLLILDAQSSAPALAGGNFRHPAFIRLLRHARRVTLPAPALACGTPETLDALAALVKARDAAGERR
jgi:iron complex transport system substrate-binding protein